MDDFKIGNMDKAINTKSLYSITELKKALFGKFYLKNFKAAAEFITISNLVEYFNIHSYYMDNFNTFIKSDDFGNLFKFIQNEFKVTLDVKIFKIHDDSNKNIHYAVNLHTLEYLEESYIKNCQNHTGLVFSKDKEQSKNELQKFKKLISFDFSYDNDYNLVDVGISSCFDKKQIYKHYIVEENYSKTQSKHSKYFSFNFGKTKIRNLKNIKRIVNEMVMNSDCVLLHDSSNDIRVLEKIALEPSMYESKIIDTSVIFNHNKQLTSERTSLKDLLIKSGIGFKSLHNSGNDAAYTLKAFLKNIKKIY